MVGKGSGGEILFMFYINPLQVWEMYTGFHEDIVRTHASIYVCMDGLMNLLAM